LKSIRPRALLQLCEDSNLNESPMSTFLPPSDIGSIRMIEASMLVSLIRLFQPSNFLEFGTYQGYSTSLFSLNSKSQAKIYTVDLPAIDPGTPDINPEEILTNGAANDKFLVKRQFDTGSFYCDSLAKNHRDKIVFVKENSIGLDLDSPHFPGEFDFVFIDGGHDYKTAMSDSLKSISKTSTDGTIVWHDFGTNLHTDVSRVVKDLSKTKPIIYIEGTSLALHSPRLLNLLDLVAG